MRHKVTLSISACDRKTIRKDVVNAFLEEECGKGKGENCSHYDYTVETLSNGATVHLRRPAPLNKGFDFIVYVPDVEFHSGRQRTVPSHPDIFRDLKEKIEKHPELTSKLQDAIDKVYNCESLTEDDLASMPFTVGIPIEVIMAAIKWLFIEQDITYWNWTGRNMLYGGLKELFD